MGQISRFLPKKKFIAILSQKLGVNLKCFYTCYITHRVSGYRIKDELKWQNGQQQHKQTQLKSARIVP